MSRWGAAAAALLAMGLGGLVAPAAAHAAPAGPVTRAAACGPSFKDQLTDVPWPLRRLRPETAWPLTRGAGVVVAVIDSGVSVDHRKLAGQVLDGRDFLQPDAPNAHCDQHGHGTLVAALIAGHDSSDSPFHGVAPDAKILPIRVLPNTDQTSDAALPRRIAEAITWATDHGAKVINLSLTTEDTTELAAAVRYAIGRDVVVVAAAGNNGGTPAGEKPSYPAAYPGVIAVAGTDQNDKRVSTSSTGGYIDVAAPGVAIEGPAPAGNGYVVDTQGGTSFASAYVSGVAALVRASAPRLAAADVARRITLTADAPPSGRDAEVGAGVVNPYRAVAAILDTGTAAPTPQPGALTAPSSAVDPLRTVRMIAVLTAVSGAVVTLVLVVAIPGVRRLRRRAAANQSRG